MHTITWLFSKIESVMLSRWQTCTTICRLSMMHQVLYTVALEKMTHCWKRFEFLPYYGKSWSNKVKWMTNTWLFKLKAECTWRCVRCPLPSFPSCFTLDTAEQNIGPFAMGNRSSKLIGLPPQLVCVCVCARPNPKQVSIISPVEALAQRELIIHTVTLFTVALCSFHLSFFSAFFQGPGAKIQLPSQRLSNQVH